jgi:hypothetical protein
MNRIEFNFSKSEKSELLRLLPDEGIEHIQDACTIWLALPIDDGSPCTSELWNNVRQSATSLIDTLDKIDLFDAGEVFATQSRFEIVRELAFRGKGQNSLKKLLQEIITAADYMGASRPQKKRRAGAPSGNLWILAAWASAVCMRFDIIKRPSPSSEKLLSIMDLIFRAIRQPNGPRHSINRMLEILFSRDLSPEMFGTREGCVYNIIGFKSKAIHMEYGVSDDALAAAYLKRRGEPIPMHLQSVPATLVRYSPPPRQGRQ